MEVTFIVSFALIFYRIYNYVLFIYFSLFNNKIIS